MDKLRRAIAGAQDIVQPLPVKGQLIKVSLGNPAPIHGTQDLYRVVRMNNNIAEIIAMYSPVG